MAIVRRVKPLKKNTIYKFFKGFILSLKKKVVNGK